MSATNLQNFSGDVQIRGTTFIKANTATNNLAIGTDAGTTVQGDQTVAVGNQAGNTSQSLRGVAVGGYSGNSEQGDYAVAMGWSAGLTSQGDRSVAVGIVAGQSDQGTSAVAVGRAAGQSAQGTLTVAIGHTAGQISQGVHCVAVGQEAGKSNQGAFSTALGSSAGSTSQGVTAVAIGRLAGLSNQGDYATAVGKESGKISQGDYTVAVGSEAGETNQGAYATAIGINAGKTSQGVFATALGSEAGKLSQEPLAVAIGRDSGTSYQGCHAVAVGYASGNNKQGKHAVAVGHGTGQVSQGNYATAVGHIAGNNNQGIQAVAVGYAAGQTSQGNEAVAVGYVSGTTNQGLQATAVGFQSGQVSQAAYGVAVGFYAGQSAQGTNAVAVGRGAGGKDQGTHSTAVGYHAARSNQGNNATALGNQAGEVAQGNTAVAVGNLAGGTSQAGNGTAVGNSAGKLSQGGGAVAVGILAGGSNQGTYAQAIGYQAGETGQGQETVAVGNGAGMSAQGAFSTALGSLAGKTSQGIVATAIGRAAGMTSQGAFAIAIGYRAGYSEQGAHSIILNGTNAAFNSTTASSFHVKPVRGGNIAASVLGYTSAGEIFSETGTNFDSSGNVTIGQGKKLHLSADYNQAGAQITLDKSGNTSWGSAGAFSAYRFFETRDTKNQENMQLVRIGAGGMAITGRLENYAPPPYTAGGNYSLIVSNRIGIQTTAPSASLHVNGDIKIISWQLVQVSGDLLFKYNGTTKGFIHWNITGSTWMNFTGQHRTFIKDVPFSQAQELEGLIVSADQNKYIKMAGGIEVGSNAITINESLPVVSLCTKIMDKKCFGVISTSEDPEQRTDTYGNFSSILEKEGGDTRVYINSLGEGAIWVSNINGSLESGDYITTSNVAGYGQKQDSEFLANYTVAKITMDCDFEPMTQSIQNIKKKLGNVNYWVLRTNSDITEEEYSNLNEESRTIIIQTSYSNEEGEIFPKEYNNLESSVQSTYTELTKTIYQKSVKEEETKIGGKEGYELEVRNELVNVLDEHNQIQWEDDPSGATEKAYKIRYLDASGAQTDEVNAVHIAAFVGCTYHCG